MDMDAIWDGEWVGQRMGVIDAMVISEWEGADPLQLIGTLRCGSSKIIRAGLVSLQLQLKTAFKSL